MDKWYQDVYRRNLVDMHINDTKKIYLSRFDAKKYFEYLKEARIQSPMIYLQSHTGLCNFETKAGKTHRFFKEHPEEMKKLYTKKEMREVVLLDKAQDYIYKNAKVKFSYKIAK